MAASEVKSDIDHIGEFCRELRYLHNGHTDVKNWLFLQWELNPSTFIIVKPKYEEDFHNVFPPKKKKLKPIVDYIYDKLKTIEERQSLTSYHTNIIVTDLRKSFHESYQLQKDLEKRREATLLQLQKEKEEKERLLQLKRAQDIFQNWKKCFDSYRHQFDLIDGQIKWLECLHPDMNFKFRFPVQVQIVSSKPNQLYKNFQTLVKNIENKCISGGLILTNEEKLYYFTMPDFSTCCLIPFVKNYGAFEKTIRLWQEMKYSVRDYFPLDENILTTTQSNILNIYPGAFGKNWNFWGKCLPELLTKENHLPLPWEYTTIDYYFNYNASLQPYFGYHNTFITNYTHKIQYRISNINYPPFIPILFPEEAIQINFIQVIQEKIFIQPLLHIILEYAQLNLPLSSKDASLIKMN